MQQHGKHRMFVIALALMGSFLFVAASAQQAQESKPGQTSKPETLSAAPEVRTVSGVVRGVTPN